MIILQNIICGPQEDENSQTISSALMPIAAKLEHGQGAFCNNRKSKMHMLVKNLTQPNLIHVFNNNTAASSIVQR
jgi:hypothetical protein